MPEGRVLYPFPLGRPRIAVVSDALRVTPLMLHSRLSKGLRAVALFEIAKGLIGLWIGYRLMMRGKDYVLGGAQWLIRHLHLDATQGAGQRMLDFVNHMDSGHVVMFVSL